MDLNFFRHAKAAVSIIATFLVASCLITALVSLHFNYTHKVSAPLESFGYLYEKAWTRLGPYIMGLYQFICKHKIENNVNLTSFYNHEQKSRYDCWLHSKSF